MFKFSDLVHVFFGFFSSILSLYSCYLTFTNTIIYLFYQYIDREEYNEKLMDIVEYTFGLVIGEVVVLINNIY